MLVRIALHKCSGRVLTVLMFCERGTAGWHQSRGCGWVFWCARGALDKHSFERSPLYEFLLQPSPWVDFYLVLNTCGFSSIQYSDFKNRPILTNHKSNDFVFCPLNLRCSWSLCLTAAVVRIKVDIFDVCLPVSWLSGALVLIQLRAYYGPFCHEQYNPVRLFPVETSDLFWNPGSCMDI